ncbi:MAG: preprotein translocase subunit SecG [Phycisphaerales bacterium]
MLVLANWLTSLLTMGFVLVALVMILAVLIQKPKGGGLAGAFGGGGGSQQAMFGAKVGDVLTYFTIGAFVLFIGLAIALVFSTRYEAQKAETDLAPPPVEMPAPGSNETPAPSKPGQSESSSAAPGIPAPGSTETPAAPAPTPAPAAPATPAEGGH